MSVQVENSKCILCSRKTGVRGGYLRFFKYKVLLLVHFFKNLFNIFYFFWIYIQVFIMLELDLEQNML